MSWDQYLLIFSGRVRYPPDSKKDFAWNTSTLKQGAGTLSASAVWLFSTFLYGLSLHHSITLGCVFISFECSFEICYHQRRSGGTKNYKKNTNNSWQSQDATQNCTFKFFAFPLTMSRIFFPKASFVLFLSLSAPFCLRNFYSLKASVRPTSFVVAEKAGSSRSPCSFLVFFCGSVWGSVSAMCVQVFVCVCVCMYVHMCVCVCLFLSRARGMYVHVRVCARVGVHMYVCDCVYVCVCVSSVYVEYDSSLCWMRTFRLIIHA